MNVGDQDNTILQATGLTKSYGRPPARAQVLHGADLSVRRGEFVAVMGPSGCGKSTLLHILGLMSRPDGGALTIDGQDVLATRSPVRAHMRRRMLGFVFQRFNLLTTVNAVQNIAISLRVRGLKVGVGQITELLEQMGVGHVARRKSSQMSIGEQQRVAVARAMAHKPAIVMADEPTGSLDTANANALLDLLAAANVEGQTIVMITHSLTAAARADRLLIMTDGRISTKPIGSAPIAPDPLTAAVARGDTKR